jgi:hypothetical protein
VTIKVKFNDFEIITRSRSVPDAVSSRSDVERLSVGLLQNETPLPKPVRLLGVSLSGAVRRPPDHELSRVRFGLASAKWHSLRTADPRRNVCLLWDSVAKVETCIGPNFW